MMPTIQITMTKSRREGHHARGEHLLQHVDVGGHARHQTPHRITVEVAHRQFLHVRKNRHAQIRQTALRHQHGKIILGKYRDRFADQGGEKTAA